MIILACVANLQLPLAKLWQGAFDSIGLDDEKSVLNNTPCDIECDFLREVSECSLKFRTCGCLFAN